MLRVRFSEGGRLARRWGSIRWTALLLAALALGTQAGAQAPPDRAAALHGQVTTSATTPMAGAQVIAVDVDSLSTASPLLFQTTTDPDGQYRLDGLPAGSWLVAVRAAMFQGASAKVELEPGEDQELNFDLMPAAHLAGALGGTVTDAHTGLPLPRTLITLKRAHDDPSGSLELASIDLEDVGLWTLTDQDGQYEFDRLPPATYHVRALHVHYEPAERAADVTSGHLTVVDFALTPIMPPTPGAIAGLVSDALTSAPLAGARVEVSGPTDDIVSTTDLTGHYRIDGLRPDTYRVLYADDGYWPQIHPIQVVSSHTTEANIRLRPFGLETGSIGGTIRDAATSAPLAGARVWVVPLGELTPTTPSAIELSDAHEYEAADIVLGSAITDENGHYVIERLPAGPVEAHAYKNGYRPGKARTQVTPNVAVRVDLALQPTGHRHHGGLAGMVSDAQTGDPLPGAWVVLLPGISPDWSWLSPAGQHPLFTRTGNDGHYKFEGVPVGQWQALAVKSGYGPGQQMVTIVAGQTARADFRLSPPWPHGYGQISGMVTDGATSRPLAGATVAILSPDHPYLSAAGDWLVHTDEHGRYLLRHVPAGQNTVAVAKRGYVPQRHMATVNPGARTELNFALLPAVQWGSVEGVVLDAATSRPLAGALVFVPLLGPYTASPDTTFHTRTGDGGRYRIDGVPAGDQTVVAWKQGYYLDAQRATVMTGQATEVDFGLSPWPAGLGRTLHIQAINALTGHPLAGAHIQVAVNEWFRPGSSWDLAGGTTDAGGWLTLTMLPPGDWPMVGVCDGYRPLAMAIDSAPSAARDGPQLSGTGDTLVLRFVPQVADSAAQHWTAYP